MDFYCVLIRWRHILKFVHIQCLLETIWTVLKLTCQFKICNLLNIHNIILRHIYFSKHRYPCWKWIKQGSLSLCVDLGLSGVNANLLMPHISDITVNTVTLINAICLRSLIFDFSGDSLLTLNDSYTYWLTGGHSYHVSVTLKHAHTVRCLTH